MKGENDKEKEDEKVQREFHYFLKSIVQVSLMVKKVVQRQVELGLDIVTDGEVRLRRLAETVLGRPGGVLHALPEEWCPGGRRHRPQR